MVSGAHADSEIVTGGDAREVLVDLDLRQQHTERQALTRGRLNGISESGCETCRSSRCNDQRSGRAPLAIDVVPRIASDGIGWHTRQPTVTGPNSGVGRITVVTDGTCDLP